MLAQKHDSVGQCHGPRPRYLSFVEFISLKPQFHLHIVFTLGVIQDIPWNRIVIQGWVVIIVAVVLCVSSPLLRSPFLTYNFLSEG